MTDSEVLVKKVVEGLQEKKGKKIAVIDLSEIENTICSFFVVCEGDSSTHVEAVAGSVVDYVSKNTSEKPLSKDGFGNAYWIAVDYGDVIVHVFQKEPRRFYNIESLWADGKLTWIEDIN